MKGTIVKCLEELVVSQFGKDKWEKSLEDVGLKKNTMFFTVSDVEDAQVMKVVGAVCTNLGITLPQAADAFGDYWVNTYAQKLYGQFFQKHKSAKDFMLDMDNVHINMTKTMKDAKPPRFKYEWKNDKTLVISYNSNRGLIDFAMGLTRGVGKYYNEKLAVSKLSPEKFQVVFA